ncbi:hypothetical protein IEQ34_018184 [Dendrobium chrysotoxum]|uniref:Transposase n=1 Tax=Dendrobium chrysotoxum TaxID=161865 RepID=A0AAV7GDR1_DENCH|nr:hypothetical protein IEQ34_018184 [Dendrobium chrysotoxum]
MDPINIPWIRRPGQSWSLVYLVRGDSRPNLTEGSLSAAMGYFVQGDLVDLGCIVTLLSGWHEAPHYPDVESLFSFIGSLPASPPFRGKKSRVIDYPPRQERRARSVSWDTAAVVFVIHHAKKGVYGSSKASL